MASEHDLNSHLSPARLVWRRFIQNRLGMLGLVIIFIAALIAVFGALLRPDSSKDANNQQLSIAKKPMGFQVEMLRIKKDMDIEPTGLLQKLFFGGSDRPYQERPLHSFQLTNDSIRGFFYGGSDSVRGEPFAFKMSNIAIDLNESISDKNTAAQEAVNESNQTDTGVAALHNFKAHNLVKRRYYLGTDKFGRDMLSRLMAGTLVSLSVGIISVLISLFFGIGLGAIAGYFGGWIDDGITWLINVVWSIPTLLLVIAITFALGKGFVQVFIAVGLTMWVEVARVVRGQVLSLKAFEFVEAARAMGYGNARIILIHIIPNSLGPVIVISAANFASAILLEAGLSFLGIGAQIPMASWGQMIKEHYAYITTDLAFLAILPGICILLLVLSFMLIGSALRDCLDIRIT